jgi:hypothetical protein
MAVLNGTFPALQAAASNKPPAAHGDCREGSNPGYLAVDHVVDVRLRTAKVSGDFGDGQDFISYHTAPNILALWVRRDSPI